MSFLTRIIPVESTANLIDFIRNLLAFNRDDPCLGYDTSCRDEPCLGVQA